MWEFVNYSNKPIDFRQETTHKSGLASEAGGVLASQAAKIYTAAGKARQFGARSMVHP